MGNINTNRYKINFKEVLEGGPVGYESVYLNSEGQPASKNLYNHLREFKGKLLPVENEMIRQRNGSALVYAISKNKPLGIASGFKPSGAYHFGHKLASSAVSFFQKNGAQIFIPVADLECMLDKKLLKERYLYWAADNLLDWGANGVDLDAAHVYFQSQEHNVANLAYLLARGLTFDLAIDTYGLEKLCGNSKKQNDKGEFPFLFAGITQVGDIMLPQHSDFGNYHSFMVSGQDQDGHMKMTSELAKRAFASGIELPGISTIPSAFYIPHIRGIIGKASSSKPETTLYLGSGPLKETIEGRIKSSLTKLDNTLKDVDLKENVKYCALDMVRYIDFFNNKSTVDFGEVIHDSKYKKLTQNFEKVKDKQEREVIQKKIDDYLGGICESAGQNNIEIIRDSLKDSLIDHQQKRSKVLQFALELQTYRNTGLWDSDNVAPKKPDFWKVPNQSIVTKKDSKMTPWYKIISLMGDKLIP